MNLFIETWGNKSDKSRASLLRLSFYSPSISASQGPTKHFPHSVTQHRTWRVPDLPSVMLEKLQKHTQRGWIQCSSGDFGAQDALSCCFAQVSSLVEQTSTHHSPRFRGLALGEHLVGISLLKSKFIITHSALARFIPTLLLFFPQAHLLVFPHCKKYISHIFQQYVWKLCFNMCLWSFHSHNVWG